MPFKHLGELGAIRGGQAVKVGKALERDTPIFSQEIGVMEQSKCTRQEH